MSLSPSQLRNIGFSRQKATYARDLAETILSGSLVLTDLRKLSDHDAREQLIACRGIGPWTADIYLLMALRRPDVWPAHDLALAVAAQCLERSAERPDAEGLARIGRPWTPWRAVAARILWHYYLSAGLNRSRRRKEQRRLSSRTS